MSFGVERTVCLNEKVMSFIRPVHFAKLSGSFISKLFKYLY